MLKLLRLAPTHRFLAPLSCLCHLSGVCQAWVGSGPQNSKSAVSLEGIVRERDTGVSVPSR